MASRRRSVQPMHDNPPTHTTASSSTRHVAGRASPARSIASNSSRSHGPRGGNSKSQASRIELVEEDQSESDDEDDEDRHNQESAQARHARLTQQNGNAYRINGLSLHNTSVNIATAFNQATEASFNLHHVSDSDRYPRKETHVPPPSRSYTASSSSSRMRSPIPEPPPSRTEAVSPPGNRRERAKSPVLDAIAGAARALSPVSFLLKPRVGRAPEFPEEDEDEDEFPQQTEYQSFASVGDGRARMFDGSFLSATTAAGDTTDGGNSSMADASRSVAERSNYSFEEEERLMREIEEKKRKAAERDAKGKAVEAGQRGTGGWFTNLGGLSEPQQVQSRSRRDVEQEDHEEEEEEIDVDEQPAHGDLDPDQVVKSTTRRRPRVSHDDKAFAYQPGDSASESESDGDGGRRSKTRRRRSGKIGPLGAEGMKPVMEGKRRKGRKGGRGKGRESSGLGTQDEGEDENEVDVNETFDAQLHQQTLDDADASFVVHLRREQQRQRRQASHPPTPVSSSSSHLPTHYKTVLGPLGFVQHHLSRILRSALVALIFLFNTTLAVARWSMEQPSQILDGLVTSLQSVEARKVWTVLGSAVLLGTLASLIDPRSTPTSHPPSPVHLYSSSSSAWNPFRSRSDSSTTPFRTPDLPPDSMDELLSRLSSLESALGSLSSQASNSADTVSRSDARLDGIDARLSSELRRLSSSSAQQAHEEKERMQSLDRVVGRIREDVDTLNGRVKSMATKVDDNSESVVKLDTIFEGVRSAVKSLSERVKDAERTAKETSDATRIARIATDAVENYLPSRLVVKMNPKTKQLELDPAFWTALRSVFTEHGQVGSVVSSEINKLKATLSIQSTPSSSASSATTIVRESTPSSPPTWSDFLASNEAALQAWSRAELDQQAQAGAVVSRATFLEMLHRELETLKADVSKQLDVNARQLSDEFSRDRLETRTNNGSPRPDITQPVLADLPESRVTSLLQGLIDSALLRYSKDTLARTDFALYTAGGRVIPSITSDTYEIETPSSFFSRLTGKRAILGRPPVTALHPDTNLGNCWPFAGAKGQLGILLARPTIVNAITIEHAAREISLDMAAAPREIQVWGLVETASDRTKVAAYQAATLSTSSSGHPKDVNSPSDDEASSLPNISSATPLSADHILLGSFAYDIDQPNHVQTFEVPQAVRDLAVATGIVVVQINSNFGADYTCLYRVRVHGDLYEGGLDRQD